MAYCPSCGNQTGTDDRFCAKCGKTITPVEASNVVTDSPLVVAETQSVNIGGATPKQGTNKGLPVPPIILYAALVLFIILGGVATVLWQSANGKVSELIAERDALVAENDDLSTQVQNLSAQVTTLSGSITTLENAKAQVEAQLSSIQSKYPLRNFASYGELQNWLYNAITKLNPSDDYPAQYYMLQRLAMDDGYFLSVAIWEDESFYYPELYAVVGDTVYICFEDGSIYVSFYLN